VELHGIDVPCTNITQLDFVVQYIMIVMETVLAGEIVEERDSRYEVSVKLTRRLSQRPTAKELQERGILRGNAPGCSVEHLVN
jgi:hypothetical protein